MKAKFFLTALLLLISSTTIAQQQQPQFRVDRFTSNYAWNANSWILESESGLVLIDAQLLRSDVKHLAAMLRSYGKPLAGVIITHPHPDHFLGLTELRRQMGDFPIIGSGVADSVLEGMHKQFLGWATPVYGDDVETELTHMTQLLDKDTKLELAGITLHIDLVGPGESADHLVIYQPDRKLLFTGDVTMHHAHHYVGEGRSRKMLAQLAHIKSTYSELSRIMPGHGDPGRLAILDDQAAYVRKLQQTFDALANVASNHDKSGGRLSDEARKKFIDQVTAAYPTLSDFGIPLDQMVMMNLAGLEREFMTTP